MSSPGAMSSACRVHVHCGCADSVYEHVEWRLCGQDENPFRAKWTRAGHAAGRRQSMFTPSGLAESNVSVVTRCTLHVARYTLHVASYTLYVARYSFHVIRCTLLVPRYTLHVIRCTLYVARYTLHVARYTLYVARYMLHKTRSHETPLQASLCLH